MIRVGILTISDRCARGIYKDKSGPALREIVQKKGWVVAAADIVSDEKSEIVSRLLQWCDQHKLDVILTTGGTGVGPRDVAPEATRAALDKELPGFSELMRIEGQAHTPLAPLSRSISGVRKETLVVNLPGNPEGATQSLRTVEHLIPHALKMIHGEGHERSFHHEGEKFRPHTKEENMEDGSCDIEKSRMGNRL